VRLELLVAPELGEHLSCRCVGIDRAQRHLTGRDVVGVVDVALVGDAEPRIHREDHVGLVDADLARDVLAHLERRIEVAVLVAQEDDVLHAEDLRGLALLRVSHVAQLVARHVRVLRTRCAVRDHAVRDLDARLGPLRDRAGHAELGVIGMRIDDHRPLDLEVLVEAHA
jgi:hypothetical protein